MKRSTLLLTTILLIGLAVGPTRSQAQGELTHLPLSSDAAPYWPSFGYDRANTSRSPHPGPQSAEIAWTYPAPKGRVINQQPTVDADGTVYFATWGSYVEGTGDRARGKLYAVNPDGTEKWTYDPGPLEGYYLGTIETSATIGPDGTIYFGRGDGILRAVNADGSEKWSFETYSNEHGRAQIFSSPAIAEDGTIYFGTGVYNVLLWTLGTNVFYALNPDGSVKWTYPANAAEGGSLNEQIFMNPAIGHDGTVYFSSGFTTYAINPDGIERWRKTTIRNMWNTAVGPDGTVYVQGMYTAGGTGAIYALNPEDGSRKWLYAVAEPTVSKVAVAGDGTLYFGSGTHGTTDEPQNIGKLYAIVDCGQDCVQEKWTEPVDFGSSVGTPTIDAEGTIYVALRGDTSTQLSAGLGMAGAEADPPVPGQVVALRDLGASADILWTIQAVGEIWQGNPVIGADYTLYFADAVCIHDPVTQTDCDEDSQIPSLYAVRVPESQCVRDANANGRGDIADIQATAADLSCRIYLPLVVAGWRQPWPTATSTPTLTSTPTATPTPTEATLQTPHDVDRLPNGNTLITDGGPSGRSPAATPGGVSRIIEIDGTGRIVWSHSQGLSWAHNADRLPNGNTLISNTGPNTVVEIDAAGRVVWSSGDVALSDGSVLRYPNDANLALSGANVWPPGNHLLITDRDNHRVIEIDRDGTIVWQFGETGVSGSDASHLNGPHNADRLSNGNTVIADSVNNRIIEVAPDGTIVWEYKPTGPAALHWPRDADRLPNGNTLVTDSRNNRVIEVSPTGEVVWQYADLSMPYDADRLDNGNTLISRSRDGRVIEVDAAGNVVWQYPPAATPTGYLIISYNANYMRGSPANVQQATVEEFVPALNRHLDLMDRLGEGQGSPLRADYYFTGLAAEKLDEWSHETVTRLLESPHGVHYHGANRPPYPQLVDQVLGEDWEQDVATTRIYEADGVNPATGEHVGGVTAFREVFGQDPFATGRFFEASILAVDKEMGARMAVGLTENTGAGRDDAWFLGVLNRPTQAGLGASALVEAALTDQGEDYLSHARTILTGVSGPMPLVAFPIHDHDFFGHVPADQEKVWALYEQVLLLAQDLGFQVVTMRDVYAMVRNGPAPTLTPAELLQTAQSLVQVMETTGYPPEFVQGGTGAGGQGGRGAGEPGSGGAEEQEWYVSLAEAFEGLVQALAVYRQTGSLPASVETHDLPGPTVVFTSSVTVSTLPANAVLNAALAVSAAITDRIPSQVTVGSQTVNPAEFLYLMAQEYLTIAQGGPAPVTLHPVSTLPLAVAQNYKADPLTRLQFWTYKPAIFAAAG